MLKELIQEGYGVKEDLNCAETILYAANRVYHLDLNSDSLKLAAAFGGGMGFDTFQKERGDILCKPLKDNYRTEEKKCREVILKGAEVLDKIITRELNKRKNNN